MKISLVLMEINEKENRIRTHVYVVFMKIEHVLLFTQGVPVSLFLVSFAFLMPLSMRFFNLQNTQREFSMWIFSNLL